MTETTERLLLSLTDAADRIGVKRPTMYDLVGKGELEAVKIGSRRLITADSIENYVARLRAAGAE